MARQTRPAFCLAAGRKIGQCACEGMKTTLQVTGRVGGIFLLLLCVLPSLAAPLDKWYVRSPLPTAFNLNAVAYGNGKFIAVGDGGTMVISTNATDWFLAAPLVAQKLNSVAFATTAPPGPTLCFRRMRT
jgi:hypothetical protein